MRQNVRIYILKGSTALSLAVVSALVAVIFVLVHHSEKSLEFTAYELDQVGESHMDLSFLVCDPSVIPVGLDEIDANLYGNSEKYGTLHLAGKNIPPNSYAVLMGRLDFNDFDSMKSVIDDVLSNQSGTDLHATVLFRERILGLIPYSYEKNYEMPYLADLILGRGDTSCQTKSPSQDIEQQLYLVRERMSAAGLLYSGRFDSGNSDGNGSVLP